MLHTNKSNEILCLDTYVIRDKGCISYCCSDPLNLEKKLKIATQAGYSAVELWHKDVNGFIQLKGVDYLNKILNENKLFVASYKVMSFWFEGNDNLSEIETAASIGAKCCVVKLNRNENQQPKKENDWYVKRYKELLSITKKLNIKPAIEFMSLSPFLNKITDVYDILDHVDDPQASLVLDTWHLWRGSNENFTNYEQTISRLNPDWIAIVHFTDASKNIPRDHQSDGDRKLPTLGCLNLKKFYQMTPKNITYSLNVYDRSLWDYDPLEIASKGKNLMSQCLKC
jgi:2-keto-myo-inositol isomerase